MSIPDGNGAAHQKRDVRTATKILVLMGRKGLTQTLIAQRHGVGRQAINRTVWGLRRGNRLRTAIARELGFETWDELKAERVTL